MSVLTMPQVDSKNNHPKEGLRTQESCKSLEIKSISKNHEKRLTYAVFSVRYLGVLGKFFNEDKELADGFNFSVKGLL